MYVHFRLVSFCTVLLLGVLPLRANAQDDGYDASWYDPARPYVKIAVVEDGVYAVSGRELQEAGVPVHTADAASFQLFEQGRHVPIRVVGTSGSLLGTEGTLRFVGYRNRGDDEAWAYDGNASLQSSTYRSLYTDTTYYWLTWGTGTGRRYATPAAPTTTSALEAVRDTVHLEKDRSYVYGDSHLAGHPLYTRGEGYYWMRFTGAREATFTVPLHALDPSDDARVRVRLNSESASCHRTMLDVRWSSPASFEPVDTVDWQGYDFQNLNATLAAAAVPENADAVTIRLRTADTFEDSPSFSTAQIEQCEAAIQSGTPNHVLLDWIEVDYRRILTANDGQQSFTLPGTGAFSVQLKDHGGEAVYVYDASTESHWSGAVDDGGTAEVAIEAGSGQLWAVSDDAHLPPAAIVPDRPSNWAGMSNRADYVVLTTASLRASAEELAQYRRAHDGYTVQVVDVQDVFDEFDYGRPAPIAIRRFVRATQQWERPPTLLAIWADAAFPVHTELQGPRRPDWAVPSFGHAPSDGWFAMQTSGQDDWTESVGIGRITIRTNEQGRTFLEKVRRYEASEPAAWPKRMLVLAGGTSASQQASLQFYSREWADVAAAVPTGMDTLFYFKSDESALDATFQDSLRLAFQRGAAWLNYFGHSAANTWEIVTDAPRDFGNAGRLPFVVSLGCRTGSFAGGRFEDKEVPSFGEQLIMGSSNDDPTPTFNGAIAHFGASDSGTISSSEHLNDYLVDRVFQDTMRVLGRAVQLAKSDFARARGNVKHSLQYGLIGDPGTRLAIPDMPDLAVRSSDVSVEPVTPIPADSHLTVATRIHNFGLVPADSVTVELTHAWPGGTVRSERRRIAPFALEHRLTLPVPIDERHVGDNRLNLTIDPEHRVEELTTANNQAEQRRTVFSSSLALVTPRDAGTVNGRRPRLRVALASADQVGLPVVFEIDTTAAFESPIAQTTIQGTQIYADWRVPRPLEDGRTYFWRARLNAPGAADTWRRAAFTVRTDLDRGGWLQQGVLFEKNTTSETLGFEDGRWDFDTYSAEVLVTSERGSGNHKGNIYVNGTQLSGLNVGFGFGLAVLDGRTGAVKTSGSFCTYDVVEQWRDDWRCVDDTEAAEAVALLDSVLHAIEEGDHLFVRTRHLARESSAEIPESVRRLFRPFLPHGEPASIDTMTYRHLWTMYAQKGNPSATVQQVVPPELGDVNEITRRVDLQFLHPNGTTTTPLLGPAVSWQSLNWQATLSNAESNVSVEVLSQDGEVLLGPQASSPFDLSHIETEQHPYVRLRASLTDSSQASTPQLHRWHVTYDGVADVALDPSTLTATADTLQEGQPLGISVALRNLSNEAADRVVLEARHIDARNEARTAWADTLGLAADSAYVADITMSTVGFPGDNRIELRAHQPDHDEAVTYNNLVVQPFFVRTDDTPPLCRVLVDGRALAHAPGDVTNLQSRELPLVGGQPTIEIEVEDENPFRALDDSSVVTLRFGASIDGAGGLPRIPLSDPSVTFEEAKEPGGAARVIFTPDLRGGDSTYTFAVTVRDASGNQRNAERGNSYQVHFRVQQDIRVESLYPYPNPMSSYTRFAFRLEGADPSTVEEFRLRIYTLSGRLVRQFDLSPPATLLELNDGRGLRIDWNTLTWDTRDEDGDLVAPGVYLYRVFLRAEGRSLGIADNARVEKLVVLR